jgi:prepilin-type N-terminal cleavage/methylation domain-containing protein
MSTQRFACVCRAAHSAAGFTLIELLVVVTVIGILVGLLLPAVQGARESGRRTSCNNNLHQVGIGLLNYQAAFETFPPGCTDRRTKQIAWSVWLLPFIEQDVVYKQFNFGARFNAAQNREATSNVIPTYLCPSTSRRESGRIGGTTGDKNGNGRYDPGDWMGCTDYGGVFGSGPPNEIRANGMMIWDRAIGMMEIRDDS